jgi:hypothetical protein
VRTFTAGVSTATEWRLDGLRSVSRATSEDFIDWTEPVPLNPNFPGEHIYTTPFRRFTLRTDGFASVHGGADAGELLTKPLVFAGNELSLNYSTSAGGSVKLEIQDEHGKAVPGHAIEDHQPMVGDSIDQVALWKKNKNLSPLAGKTIRLRFVLQEADVFALQFRPDR